MNIETLSAQIQAFADMKAAKAVQEEILKGMKAEIDEAEDDIIDAMIAMAEAAGLQDPTGMRVTVDGYAYGVGIKTQFNIRAEDREAGFAALRQLGLGDLITERVDDRTLTKTLRDIADEHGGELPKAYGAIPLQTYDKRALSARKVGK